MRSYKRPRLTIGWDRGNNDADVSDGTGTKRDTQRESREKPGHWPVIGGTVDPMQRLLLRDDALRRRHSDVDVVVVVKVTRRRAPEPFLVRAYRLNRFLECSEISRCKLKRNDECYSAKISNEFVHT